MSRNSSTVAEAITNASAVITNHEQMIEQIKGVLMEKTGGNLTEVVDENTSLSNQIASLVCFTGRPEARYFWIKFDEQDGNILEYCLGLSDTEYPERGIGEDGCWYQRVSHVLMLDKNNDTYILEI